VRAGTRLFLPSQSSPLEAVVLDLDGVVYRGKAAIPGAAKSINWMVRHGLKVFYLTNNSTQSRTDYVTRLQDMGIPCDEEMVFSSGYASALYLQKYGKGTTVLVVGEDGLADELKAVGVRVVRTYGNSHIDFVVVGMDRKFTYQKMFDAQQAILHGATFIASNRDPVYPVEGGVIPGGGSVVAAIEAACGKKPLLMGKPSPSILKLLLAKAGVAPSQALVIGDRLDTDIGCGRRTGAWTLAVLTGVTSREEAESAPERLRPHWILESLADVPKFLTAEASS
jgi:4-nitrophenyl phosphatase